MSAPKKSLGNTKSRLARASFYFALCLAAATILVPLARAADDALTFGVFPRRSPADTQKAMTPMSGFIAKRIGRPVKLAAFRDFDSFWKAVEHKSFDIVYYNQYHFIRSARDYRVIAHIEEFGKDTIAGVIYVRKDSGITALSQLKGRTIIFGGTENAMNSYIATTYLLLRAGIKKTDFKSVFAVNSPNAILALIRRQADAAGAGDGIADLPELMSVIDKEELTALAVSPRLLQLPIAVKRSMPADLRNSIQAILLSLKNSETGWQVLKSAGLTGMGSADDKDYEPHRKIAFEVLGSGADRRK